MRAFFAVVVALVSGVSNYAHAADPDARHATDSEIEQFLGSEVDNAKRWDRDPFLAAATDSELEAGIKYLKNGDAAFPDSMKVGDKVHFAIGFNMPKDDYFAKSLIVEAATRGRIDLLKEIVAEPVTFHSTNLASSFDVHNLAVAQVVKVFKADPSNTAAFNVLKDALANSSHQDTHNLILEGLKGMTDKRSLELILDEVKSKRTFIVDSGYEVEDYTRALARKATALLEAHPLKSRLKLGSGARALGLAAVVSAGLAVLTSPDLAHADTRLMDPREVSRLRKEFISSAVDESSSTITAGAGSAY